MAISRYAETHYKFRLPWSPLWRPWPEMVVDAPWVAVPGRETPLFLAVHDAHRFPVVLREAKVVVRAGGELHREIVQPDLKLDQPFHWIPLPWPGPETPGQNLVDVAFEVEDSRGRRRRFLNHSLPGLAPTTLEILRLSKDFPAPAGWTSGDLHCHTLWSEDPVEWGGDPATMNRAAACMGMGFWAATDHGYDFAWDHPDWMRPADPIRRFAEFRASLPVDEPGAPVVLPAEEVSCGNAQGRNIHLLLVDHPEYVPGQGDGGRRWLDNRPDLSIPQVLELARGSGAPAFAAHPRPGIGRLERMVFRRGRWEDADLHPGISGLQFWNGGTGDDFRQGMAFWIADLLRGGRRRPIAGNDAHGDLNRATQVKTPLFSLRQSRNHRFGRARTWLRLESPPSRETVRAALAGTCAPTFLSDGPFLELRPDRGGEGGAMAISAASLDEFGRIDRIRLFGHRRGETREEPLLEASPSTLVYEASFSPEPGTAYVRAELSTSLGFRALTGAVEPD